MFETLPRICQAITSSHFLGSVIFLYIKWIGSCESINKSSFISFIPLRVAAIKLFLTKRTLHWNLFSLFHWLFSYSTKWWLNVTLSEDYFTYISDKNAVWKRRVLQVNFISYFQLVASLICTTEKNNTQAVILLWQCEIKV